MYYNDGDCINISLKLKVQKCNSDLDIMKYVLINLKKICGWSYFKLNVEDCELTILN